MRGNRGFRALALAVAGVFAGGALAGCGGGERQDAKEPEGDFRVEVIDASFPEDQSIADASTMKIRVRNADTKALPNVAVTIETTGTGITGGAPQAFASDTQDPGVSDPSRPIWILDRPPSGGDTAYTNTWALGRLAAGQTKTFEWKVTAVQPGTYTVDYVVSPGLNGKAKPAGGRNKGSFRVRIDDTPPDSRVGDDGEVITTPASADEAN